MDFAQYVKPIMLVLMLVTVASALVKRGIITKVLYAIAFLAQIVITFWAIASGQIVSFASWIFFGFLILGTTILILYSDLNLFKRTRNHDTKNED